MWAKIEFSNFSLDADSSLFYKKNIAIIKKATNISTNFVEHIRFFFQNRNFIYESMTKNKDNFKIVINKKKQDNTRIVWPNNKELLKYYVNNGFCFRSVDISNQDRYMNCDNYVLGNQIYFNNDNYTIKDFDFNDTGGEFHINFQIEQSYNPKSQPNKFLGTIIFEQCIDKTNPYFLKHFFISNEDILLFIFKYQCNLKKFYEKDKDSSLVKFLQTYEQK